MPYFVEYIVNLNSCKENEQVPTPPQPPPQPIQPHITSIAPAGGAINAVVTIRGTGFGANAAAATVSFHGTKGEVISNDGQTLAAKIPQGATSGPVTVRVGENTSNGVAFEVGKELLYAGGVGADSGYSVAIGADGSKYVGGSFFFEVTFGNITLSASSEDGFLAKYSPEGEIMWVKQLTGTYNERVIAIDFGNDIAIDSQGLIYVTGSYRDFDVTFGATKAPNAGSDDVFFWKIWQ